MQNRPRRTHLRRMQFSHRSIKTISVFLIALGYHPINIWERPIGLFCKTLLVCVFGCTAPVSVLFQCCWHTHTTFVIANYFVVVFIRIVCQPLSTGNCRVAWHIIGSTLHAAPPKRHECMQNIRTKKSTNFVILNQAVGWQYFCFSSSECATASLPLHTFTLWQCAMHPHTTHTHTSSITHYSTARRRLREWKRITEIVKIRKQ